MSKEKQIEEMAKVYDNARLKARDTLGSMNEGEEMWYSKAFYNAGYRKQSEGEWIGNGYLKHCSVCGNVVNFNEVSIWLYRYCPECGAKMKGGK